MIRGVFVGSGSDGLSHPTICRTVVELAKKSNASLADGTRGPHVVYLGTATYDIQANRHRQTSVFVEQHGCTLSAIDCACATPTKDEMEREMKKADIVLVSGGNTLFAVDRWTKLGLHELLREAKDRGAVLAGGSAGAICWFDGGHSDSADPDTYKNAMLDAAAAREKGAAAPDESSKPGEVKKDWKYIRVPGLGFLPGLICPHHDKIQSNGVARASDFDSMLLRHSGETGVGIDHWAAVVVEGDEYRVLSVEGEVGSVGDDGSFRSERTGKPGVWMKKVKDGRVELSLVPSQGKWEDVFVKSSSIVPDPAVEQCRKDNPDDL